MKLLLLISILLTAPVSALAQTEAASTCPKIETMGPSGITPSGDTIIFTADVRAPGEYRYQWSVSAGTIEYGQGTSSIMVRSTSDRCERKYIATVEIRGLPAGCANTHSVTAVVRNPGDPATIDSYEKIPFSKEKNRLRAAAREAKKGNNPKLVLILVLSRTNADSLSALKKRSQNISRFLAKTGLGKKDFLIVFGKGSIYSTRIYLMPSDECGTGDLPLKSGRP